MTFQELKTHAQTSADPIALDIGLWIPRKLLRRLVSRMVRTTVKEVRLDFEVLTVLYRTKGGAGEIKLVGLAP